ALGAPTQDDVATGKEILGSVLHTFGFPQRVLFAARPDGSLSVRSSLGYSGRDEARVVALLGRQALLQAAMERNEPMALTVDGVADGEHECMLAGAGARSML